MPRRRLLLLCALLLSACTRAIPPRTVKIALVAPFEGRSRQIGYDAFPALRLAVRDAITRGPVNGVQVEFVAYNDNADPQMARRVASNVAADPDVVAVIGHLEFSTTLAALDVYRAVGLPLLVPHLAPEVVPAGALVFRMGPSASAQPARACEGCARQDAPNPADSPAAQRALARFSELSLGPPPTWRSIVAYDAAALLIEATRAALAQDATRTGPSLRAAVADQLRGMQFDGLLGTVTFDRENVWRAAPVFVYPATQQ
jgi:ABC-type branched-subunit amino acid transport system substrate-binding protein